MPGSAARTVVALYPSGSPMRGVRASQPSLMWPEKSSADVLDYVLDLSAWLTDCNDSLLSASVAVTPTGGSTDLASLTPVIVAGQLLIFFAGGVPGVFYKVAISIATVAGRKATFVALIFIDFDSPATAPVFNVGGLSMVSYDLTATGSTITDALPLTGQFNVFTDVPSGAGCKLPYFPPVPITIIHRHFGGAQLLIYPPDHDANGSPISAAFDGLAAGAPRIIPAPVVAHTETEATFVSETALRIVGAY